MKVLYLIEQGKSRVNLILCKRSFYKKCPYDGILRGEGSGGDHVDSILKLWMLVDILAETEWAL